MSRSASKVRANHSACAAHILSYDSSHRSSTRAQARRSARSATNADNLHADFICTTSARSTRRSSPDRGRSSSLRSLVGTLSRCSSCGAAVSFSLSHKCAGFDFPRAPGLFATRRPFQL